MKSILLISIFMLLSACAPAQAASTQTPAPTQVPLTEIDVSEILVLPGDLPAGFSGAQIRDTAPEMFDELPPADRETYLQFEHEGSSGGGITVLLYENKDQQLQAYDLLVEGMNSDGSAELTDVGEKAFAISNSLVIEFVDLVFIRCSILAHIRLAGTADLDAAVAYAKRLDERLTPLFCR